MPRVPGSKAQKVYSGAGFCQELISDRAYLLKKVHLVDGLLLLLNKSIKIEIFKQDGPSSGVKLDLR